MYIDVVTFYIQVRNTAVMLHHCGSTIKFSSFEVSLPPSDVLASPCRLERSYPSTTVSIPSETFYLCSFLEQLTKLLSSLSTASFATQVDDIAIHESRDRGSYNCLVDGWRINSMGYETSNFITHFLTSHLGGDVNLGLMSNYQEATISKRIADEVLLAGAGARFECTPDNLPHSPEFPYTNTWRRSPMWLVLRVTFQMTLLSPSDPGASDRSNPHWGYKILILNILTALLGVVIRHDPERSSEHLSHMSRKVACRVAKLEGAGLTIPTILQDFVSKTVHHVARVLETRFAQVKTATVRKLNWPLVGEVEAQQDTELKMVNSRSYIKEILEEYHNSAITPKEIPTSFPINESPRIYHETSSCQMIFRCAEKLEGSYSLLTSLMDQNAEFQAMWRDIEFWVETELEDFVVANNECEEACCNLSRLLTSYTDIAHKLFRPNYTYPFGSEAVDPIGASLCILTAIELWVAIDRIAISIIPLLKEYPCEVDPDRHLFTILLLPKKVQMERLQVVRTYLQNREFEATYPSIFKGYHKIDSSAIPVDCNTFSVRYFDQSPLHQALHDTIVKEACELAAADRKNKRAKLDPPFPSDNPKVKAIVFELDPPVVFATWRDAAFRVALSFPGFGYDPQTHDDFWVKRLDHDIFSHDSLIPNDKVLARHYSPKLGTVILGAVSLDNTWIYTHTVTGVMDIDWGAVGLNLNYVILGVPSNLEHGYLGESWAVCQPAGYRQHIAFPTSALISKYQQRTEHYCTFDFKDYIHGHKRAFDHPSPNVAVNYSQEETPVSIHCNLLPHQYCAFNTMLFGSRLRWLNMLREIKTRNPCLNSNNLDVLHAFLQACWQTGPQVCVSNAVETYLREAHEILHNVDFCNQMLDALESTLTVIQATWPYHLAMQVIIPLGARILSFAQAPQIQTRAAYFLRLCRAACMDWLVEVSRCIQSLPVLIDSSSRRKWQARGLLIVAICRQTFDVDLDVSVAIFNSEQDLGDFIECAVWPSIYCTQPDLFDLFEEFSAIYHDADMDHSDMEFTSSLFTTYIRSLLTCDVRMAYSMEPHLRHLALTNNDWFHSAIARIVPGYIIGEQWSVLAVPNDRWITTRPGGGTSMTIHYNLLQGTLFVNGETFCHELPHCYTDDPLYKRVFGDVRHTFAYVV